MRLFGIVQELVKWENTTNEKVLERARAEIRASWRRACAANADHPRAAELFDRNRLPAFHDPFAGGGSLPLEAQRLGLEAHASDLNPVAVLINKAMIEIPPKFAGRPPVNPVTRSEATIAGKAWKGAAGLAEDVRHYGKWMRGEAERRIGRLYPKMRVTPELVRERPDLAGCAGRELTVIAWLWARTVRSPNPAFSEVEVPLASTFMLSTKRGKEAWVEPEIEGRGYRFAVRVGPPPDAAKRGTKLGGSGSSFFCLMSGTPMPFDYLRSQGKAGRMGARLLAVAAQGPRGRIYLPPTPEHEEAAVRGEPAWKPEADLPERALGFRVQEYGMTRWADLFTPRQLAALTTFSDLVGGARERARRDAVRAGLPDDGRPLREGGTGAPAYAEAVSLYLGVGVDRLADRLSTISSWDVGREAIRNTFGRQAIPMTWDFAEANPFSGSSGSFASLLRWTEKFLLETRPTISGTSAQLDGASQTASVDRVVSTDPPYYDNIGYADLSDFFYVWLRRSLRPVFPELFATLAAPKADELVATPYRHGSKKAAEAFFLDGMARAMRRLAEQAHPGFPVTIYYAFKQSETKGDGSTSSTGWETFLDAVIESGFAVTGTWPMRTELSNRMIGMGTNALASSIVLVCRRRPADAPAAALRDFLTALRDELPPALRLLRTGNIAPVDLAQAAIGPGMAVYTRYARVLDPAGERVSVRDALARINRTLDEVLAEQEGDFDEDSRWAMAWFDEYGFTEGPYGAAETLSKAKNTSVEGMVEAGILRSQRGKVRLNAPRDLPEEWDPSAAGAGRPAVWKVVHHLIRALDADGEAGAARLAARLGAAAEPARDLCYRLYTLCERKKRPAEALAYNTLVKSWPEIMRLSRTDEIHQQALLPLGGPS